jgi:acyl carrier protein
VTLKLNSSTHIFKLIEMHTVLQAGLDSLGAVEFRNAIAASFGIDISATAAFDFPTASVLAQHISDLMARRLPDVAAQRSFLMTTKDSLVSSLASVHQQMPNLSTYVIGMACIYPTGQPGDSSDDCSFSFSTTLCYVGTHNVKLGTSCKSGHSSEQSVCGLFCCIHFH